MTAHAATKKTIFSDQELKGRASEAVRHMGDQAPIDMSFRTACGTDFAVGPELAEFLGDILARVAQGGQVTITTIPDSLTTTTAASVVGVSRTTLMKLINSGALASTMVGSHHRVKHSDAIALRDARRADRRAAVDALLTSDI